MLAPGIVCKHQVMPQRSNRFKILTNLENQPNLKLGRMSKLSILWSRVKFGWLRISLSDYTHIVILRNHQRGGFLQIIMVDNGVRRLSL